jgi:hypothetical protein
MSTYVYGIIRASHPSLRDDLDGIGDPHGRYACCARAS